MIIKKIFDKKIDDEVHSDFLKFGRGEYKNKYMIEAKKQKGRWAIKTGPEWANYLVRKGLERVSGKVNVTGVIVSTIKVEVPFSKETKQFMGIKQYKVNGEVDTKEVLSFMNQYPRLFYALTFSLPDYELKIKAKAPKSAKPSTKGDKEIKVDFCSLKTNNPEIAKEIFFDYPIFDVIAIRHTIKISDVIYPNEFSKMKPEDVRERSKRKGVVVREITVDGRTERKEASFEA